MLDLIQDQINGMMKAIEISIEQIHAAGPTDEARLKDFIDQLQQQGIEEVSILSKQQEVRLSSNPRLVGRRLSVLENEFLIQEKFGAEEAMKPQKHYRAFVPIISKGALEGYIHISMYFEDLERLNREMLFNLISVVMLVAFSAGVSLAVPKASKVRTPERRSRQGRCQEGRYRHQSRQ